MRIELKCWHLQCLWICICYINILYTHWALGRTVLPLVNFYISSANHVEATKYIKECRHGQEVQLFLRPNVRMGIKCDFKSNFNCRLLVPVGAGLNISETAELLGFSCTTVSRLCRELMFTSCEQQFCGQKCSVNESWSKLTGRLHSCK